MDFDYYFKKYDEEYGFNDSELCGFEIGFEAGQKSKQSEIDVLKQKLKKLEDHIFINYDYDRDDDQHSYWSGYNVAMGEIATIIKGNKNDN